MLRAWACPGIKTKEMVITPTSNVTPAMKIFLIFALFIVAPFLLCLLIKFYKAPNDGKTIKDWKRHHILMDGIPKESGLHSFNKGDSYSVQVLFVINSKLGSQEIIGAWCFRVPV